MPVNAPPATIEALPDTIPVFPLAGALLLPRGEMPLNIFEPRYVAMIDDALKGGRLVGMVQPRGPAKEPPPLFAVGCAGRIVAFSETGDGRYRITLAGLARFRIVEEMRSTAPYRRARVDFAPFAADLDPQSGEDAVDRERLLDTLRAYLDANQLSADWESIERTPNEALVNALCMMSPFGTREKQALLEAADLKARAEVLVTLTELDLAGAELDSDTPMH